MENNIHLIKFPSHLTDRLQPLDKCVFGPLKKKWEKLLIEYIKDRINNRESLRMSKKDFSIFLGKVWRDGIKPENIVRGFETTGTFPADKSKFPEDEFDPIALSRYKKMKTANTELNNSIPSSLGEVSKNSLVIRDNQNGRVDSDALENILHKTPEKIVNPKEPQSEKKK